MKKALLYSFLFAALLLIDSCKVKETVLDEMIDLVDAKIIYEGTFRSANNYTTVGKAKIVRENGKLKLVLEDFMTTPGPDLKVYLSATPNEPRERIDLGELRAGTGNFSYELPLNDIGNRTTVLIWCRRFSRLFGNAQLRMN